MKMIHRIKTALSFMAVILLMAAGTGHAEKVTILVEEDCPYSCRSETGNKGFVQDILETIFQKYGYETEFQMVPWLRALHTFNDQLPHIDGMIGMKVHPVKKGIAVFPEEEIARYTHRFYAKKDSFPVDTWKYEGIESLKNLKVGCVKGWNYCDKDISKYLAEGSRPYVQAMTGESPESRNIIKLLNGRIDLWIANISNTEYLLAKEYKAGNKAVKQITGFLDLPVTNEVNVYPVFYQNEKGLKYAEIFTKGIRELRKSGELDKIMEKYGLTDWK